MLYLRLSLGKTGRVGILGRVVLFSMGNKVLSDQGLSQRTMQIQKPGLLALHQ